MGKVKTYKYVVKMARSEHGMHKIADLSNGVKMDLQSALKKYLLVVNESRMPGGVNHQMQDAFGPIIEVAAQFIEQRTGRILASVSLSPFEIENFKKRAERKEFILV